MEMKLSPRAVDEITLSVAHGLYQQATVAVRCLFPLGILREAAKKAYQTDYMFHGQVDAVVKNILWSIDQDYEEK